MFTHPLEIFCGLYTGLIIFLIWSLSKTAYKPKNIKLDNDDFYNQEPITYESVLSNIKSMIDRGWIDLFLSSSSSVGVSSVV